VYGAAAVQAWMLSMAFHCRDTPFTELLDNLGAFALALASAAMALRRAMGSSLGPVIALLSFVALGVQVSILAAKLDHAWSIASAAAAFALGTVAWGVWAWRTRAPHALPLLLGLGLAWLAAALEVTEFFWADLLDAHATWHAATVVPAALLWSGLLADLRAETASQLRKEQ
jgi:hypothetical protein